MDAPSERWNAAHGGVRKPRESLHTVLVLALSLVVGGCAGGATPV
jgi:hypothetical protein